MNVLKSLSDSKEPCIRFKAKVNVLTEDPDSPQNKALHVEIKNSKLARALLSERERNGRIPYHPYKKWAGAHWVLSSLAEIDYPEGESSLLPLRDQVYEWLLSKPYVRSLVSIKGCTRIHASMEGNALWSTLKLGLEDSRTHQLADRLIKTQWEDGGWNCDRNPLATNSSFHESLIPLRALSLYKRRLGGGRECSSAIKRASELFLRRRLLRRVRDGRIISGEFVKIHYPPYWHYDILFALKVMSEAGFVGDERCEEALEILESKRTADGGFPCERKYYSVPKERLRGPRSLVDLGPTGGNSMNEFVTVDALTVKRSRGS